MDEPRVGSSASIFERASFGSRDTIRVPACIYACAHNGGKCRVRKGKQRAGGAGAGASAGAGAGRLGNPPTHQLTNRGIDA
jgi:hypothetical protein